MNLSNVKSEISKGDNSNSKITAQVNGVDMEVLNNSLGFYMITTPTGFKVNVDIEGKVISQQFAYESNDCSGQAYLKTNLSIHQVGYVYKNPNFSKGTLTSVNGSTGYSLNDNIIKLHSNSYSYSGNCQKSVATSIVSEIFDNDQSVTGIDSFPLLITGIGKEVKISTEVGTPVSGTEGTGPYAVFANGIKIGTTTRYPTPNSSYITVILDGFDHQSIFLNKDASYTGWPSVSSSALFYQSTDCSGNAYSDSARDGNKLWLYKNSLGFNSQLHASGNCYSTPATQKNDIFYLATPTPNPDVLIITPPITIEGYSEPTPYDTLPEVF